MGEKIEAEFVTRKGRVSPDGSVDLHETTVKFRGTGALIGRILGGFLGQGNGGGGGDFQDDVGSPNHELTDGDQSVPHKIRHTKKWRIRIASLLIGGGLWYVYPKHGRDQGYYYDMDDFPENEVIIKECYIDYCPDGTQLPIYQSKWEIDTSMHGIRTSVEYFGQSVYKFECISGSSEQLLVFYIKVSTIDPGLIEINTPKITATHGDTSHIKDCLSQIVSQAFFEISEDQQAKHKNALNFIGESVLKSRGEKK